MIQVIKPSFEVWTPLDDEYIARFLERAARNCYKSEGAITEDSAKKMISKLIQLGHTAMLEHYNITIKFTSDLGTYKDITRHRHASFAIESTRWCDYSKDKFGEMTFVKPIDLDEQSEAYKIWYQQCVDSAEAYKKMKELKATTDMVRSIINQAIKADVVMTCNIREWRYILELRTKVNVNPNIVWLFKRILKHFVVTLPTLFGDMAPIVQDLFDEDANNTELFEDRTAAQ